MPLRVVVSLLCFRYIIFIYVYVYVYVYTYSISCRVDATESASSTFGVPQWARKGEQASRFASAHG